MNGFSEIPSNPSVGDVVNELLAAVYKYYAVGYLIQRKFYFGYIEMEKIVSDKMFKECNDPQSISNVFGRRLQDKWSELKIFNQNHLCFPNYRFSLSLGSSGNIQFEQYTRLEICVSLLCDYYTLYYVDDFHVKNFATGNDALAIRPFEIYSFSSRKTDSYIDLVKEVRELVEINFPDKKYISHNLLLSHKLTAVVPYNEDLFIGSSRTHFTLFELLFNPDISEQNQAID